MKIIIMRHGEAEPWQRSDSDRNLTTHGIAQASWMGNHLLEWIGGSIDYAWISPYVRAQQTWQAVSESWIKMPDVQTVDDIIPEGDPVAVLDYVLAFSQVKDPQCLMLVSHLPLVADLVFGLAPDAPLRGFSTASIVAIDWNVKTQTGHFLWQRDTSLG